MISPKPKEIKSNGTQMSYSRLNVETQHTKAMPSLFEIRQGPLIQDKVQQRILELNQLVNTGDKKIRSQRGGGGG